MSSASVKEAVTRSYEYVFTTLPVNHIQDEFLVTIKRFIFSFADTAVALVNVAVYLILFLAKLLILVFPHAVKFGKVVVDFHQTKLSRSDIILETVSISILLIIFIFRVRIQRAWKNFIHYVSVKSKVAAKAAPHVLFFTTAIIFAVLGRNFLLPLTHSKAMPIFTLIIPLITTIRTLYSIKNLNEIQCRDAINKTNLLWVIISIYHAVVTLTSLIPFSSNILKLLPYVKEMIIVIIMWVQLSPVFSKIVFESVISHIMIKLYSMIPVSYGFNEQNNNNKTNTFFSMLKMLYIVNDTQLKFLQILLQDSVATILAIIFLFTPYPISNIGMVLISLLLPAFRTSAVVASADITNITSKELAKLARQTVDTSHNTNTTTSTSSTNMSISNIHQNQENNTNNKEFEEEYEVTELSLSVDSALNTHWLRYWICISILWCIRIYIMNIWCSIMIIITLYLQHSYFKGSFKFTSFIIGAAKAINERNKRIELEKLLQSQSILSPEQCNGTSSSKHNRIAPKTSSFSFAGLFSNTPKRKNTTIDTTINNDHYNSNTSSSSNDLLERTPEFSRLEQNIQTETKAAAGRSSVSFSCEPSYDHAHNNSSSSSSNNKGDDNVSI